jgi:error-prone DNA polymerase
MPTDYVELHCHSAYSLLDGVSMPTELIAQAAYLGMDTLALTDHNALYGVVPFVRAAKASGIRPIVGAELTLEGEQHLTLLVADQAGWRNLCTLISRAQASAPKGQAVLPRDALDGHTDGLICLSGCRQGPIATALQNWDRRGAFRVAKWLRDLFGAERCWIELQHHLLPKDYVLVRDLIDLARHLGLGYVTTNNVHYARRDGHRLHDIVTAIRHRTTLEAAGPRLRANSEYYLKSGRRLLPLFSAYPEALRNTRRIAEQCTFELRYGLQDLPRFPTGGPDATAYLAQLCHAALPRFYPTRPEQACRQLAYELRVIDTAGLSNYFLIVWDIVRFARSQGIRCQGRGSAANSLIAYLLGITPIDPLQHNLVFERFLSPERPALPDIDLDLAADRREEVVQYVFQKYKSDCAAMACTFSTFQARSALRDVAAALELPIDQLISTDAAPPGSTRALVADLCQQLYGLPRHLGQHNGGMVLTHAPLAERVPTEPAAMPGRIVIQWDKDALEEVGLVKIDLLGLRMLSALAEAERLIAETTGAVVDLDRLTFDDDRIFDMISQADTVGVFQVESRAQAQILPRLQPDCFADLVVAISLIRPGPLQGNMVHPYLRRRTGQEKVMYPHPLLRPALEETLGVILFQEQVLRVAEALAGFTRGQGEQLRRALGSNRGPAAIAPFRDSFRAGAIARGVAAQIADAVFKQLEAFGGYSFPKSHAAAFAVIVYQSAWLKYYYPAAFLIGLLNNQPMGFWPVAILVRDARRHAVRVLPVDIQSSDARCTLEAGSVKLGLNYVLGLGETGTQRILDARAVRPFVGLADLCRRTRLPRRLIEHLILAGACDGWGQPRRALLWELGTLRYEVEELDLPIPTSAVDLPPLGLEEAQELQMRLLGLSTEEHPLARWREALTARGYVSSLALSECANGQRVQLVGTLVMHQAPPTAKGYHFLTIEDELSMSNVIIRPAIAARDRRALRGGAIVQVEGVVQHEGGVVNVLATRVALLGQQRQDKH